MKIICDQMLGSLATWLRILGFDTIYISETISDESLLDTALKEQRLLITRDKLLYQKAQKYHHPSVFLPTTNVDAQLQTVLQRLPYDQQYVLTRCVLCNSILQPIDKQQVIGKVPDSIFKKHTCFHLCPKCCKIYWMGTHYDNMVKKIEMLKNK
ncbi:MAG: Mut7-C RNAse domain-containing protein [Candidatus Thermoplasmatota archaeon]